VFSGGEAKDLEGLFSEVRGLRDGGAKMSKSDPSEMSRVNLGDHPDPVMKKAKKAKKKAKDVLDKAKDKLDDVL